MRWYVQPFFDACSGGTFGLGKDQAALALTAGSYDATRAAEITAFWQRESNLDINPGGDAGPAQLTSWWKRNQPQLIVGNAYGTWAGAKPGKKFDGDPLDNLSTLSNIIGFSHKRYNNSLYSAAYHYGPGDPTNPTGANAKRIRDAYAKDVVHNFGIFKRFFDCLVSKGKP
jgi:hypothetical protein